MPRKLSSPEGQKAIVKKRHWAFVAYPESCPKEILIEKLTQSGVQCEISPLHDDVNPDETQKKPHWHIILSYEGPTTYANVAKLTASINATTPQPLEALKGYHRYLTHKDNPEKKQYSEADIISINGFTIRDYIDMTKSEITNLKRDIMHFVEEHDITEYCDLLTELDKYNLSDMWEVAANNTIFADAYIRSRRHKLEKIAADEKT
jgi:hypothetical protein